MAAIVEEAPASPGARLPRRTRRWVIIFILWSGLFAFLAFALPPVPLLRIRCDEEVDFLGISDDSSTLIGVTVRGSKDPEPVVTFPIWPVRLVDLTTGEERRLDHPDEMESRETVQEADGTLYRVAGKFRVVRNQISGSGDFLAVSYQRQQEEGEGGLRLRVVDWRTGDQVFDEPCECEHSLVGQSLFLAPRSGSSPPELWDVKRRTKTKLGWLDDYRGLESVACSPDAQWMATWSPERLRVWSVPDQQSQFELPGGTAAAVFSDDGETLASLGSWTANGPNQFIRIWRMIDVASGTVSKEQRETIEQAAGTNSPSDKTFLLRFIDHGKGMLAQQQSGPTTWNVTGRKFVQGSFYDQPLVDELGVMDYSQDQRRVLLYSFDAGIRDLPPVRNVLDLFSRLFGITRETVVSYQLWDQVDRTLIAEFGRGPEEIGFLTPDGLKAIIQSRDEYHVWGIPPGRPWSTAFLCSLLVPGTALLARFVRIRRRTA